jgi:hypothetical protein
MIVGEIKKIKENIMSGVHKSVVKEENKKK